jgi:hypothetical protein
VAASAQSPAVAPRPDRFFRGYPTTASFLEVEPGAAGLSRDALIAVDSILLTAVSDSVIRYASLAVGYKGMLVRMRAYGWVARDSARLATPATEYDVSSLLSRSPRRVAAATSARPDLFTQLQMGDTHVDSTGTGLLSSAFDLAILADFVTREGVAPRCRPQAGSGVPCTVERTDSLRLVSADAIRAAATSGGGYALSASDLEADPLFLSPSSDLYVVLLLAPGPRGDAFEASPAPAAPVWLGTIRHAVQAAILKATGD